MLLILLSIQALCTDTDVCITTYAIFKTVNMNSGDTITVHSLSPHMVVTINTWQGITAKVTTESVLQGEYSASDEIWGFDLGNHIGSVVFTATSDTLVQVSAARFMSDCESHTVSTLNPTRFVIAKPTPGIVTDIMDTGVHCFIPLMDGVLNYNYNQNFNGETALLSFFDAQELFFTAQNQKSSLASRGGAPYLVMASITQIGQNDYSVVNVTSTNEDVSVGAHFTNTNFDTIALIKAGTLSPYVVHESEPNRDKIYYTILIVGIVLLVIVFTLGVLWLYRRIKTKQIYANEEDDDTKRTGSLSMVDTLSRFQTVKFSKSHSATTIRRQPSSFSCPEDCPPPREAMPVIREA